MLVKGGDYTVETVVGAEDVQAGGGRVVLVGLVEGRSTTRLIDAIRAAQSPGRSRSRPGGAGIARGCRLMLVITGGGGFIGSVLARAAQRGRPRRSRVSSTGSAPASKWRNIAKRDFAEIVPIDGLLPLARRNGEQVEAVFHLGANSATTANDADAIIASNLNYSIALWRWCTAHGKPLIYASSAATYGDGSAGFDDAGGIEPNSSGCDPLNLYGWSKHAFDLWAMREAAAGQAPPLLGRAQILQRVRARTSTTRAR